MVCSAVMFTGRIFGIWLARTSTWSRICGKADDVTKFYKGCVHKSFYHKWQIPLAHYQQHLTTKHRNLHFLNCDTSFCSQLVPAWTSDSQRVFYSTESSPTKQNEKQQTTAAGPTETEQKLSIFQRFKKTYKEHGKVLIGVHLITSTIWFGSFYLSVRCGIDVVPCMEYLGCSEGFIKQFQSGGLGDIAIAYLMYKIATPLRYTVTIAGTNIAIRYLRRIGRMAPKSQEDSLRELYKEGKNRLRTSSLRTDRLERIKAAREKKKQELLRKLKK